MKVIILCNDFPPLNSIGAERPYSWFRYFKQFGIEPIVITKNWKEDNGQTFGQRTIEGERKEVHPEGVIIRVCHRSDLAERLALRVGMNRYGVIRRALTLFLKVSSFLSFTLDKHANIYHKAAQYLENEHVDVILATAEPFILFRYGYLLKKRFGVKWVADYRDGWWLNHVTPWKGYISNWLRHCELLFEKKYLTNADLIISVDPLLTGRLEDLHQKPSLCIYNGFWSFYNKQAKPISTTKLVITHTGTLTPGQRVEFLLQAILDLHREKKLLPEDLLVRFVGLDYYPDEVRRVIGFSEELRPYLETTPRVSRDQALEWNAGSDLLLSLSDSKVSAIYAKTYDYIAVKRSVILVPDDHSILSDFLRMSGAGKGVDDLEGLKAFLLEMVREKRKHGRCKEISIDMEKAMFFTREYQAQVLANKLKELLEIA